MVRWISKTKSFLISAGQRRNWKCCL